MCAAAREMFSHLHVSHKSLQSWVGELELLLVWLGHGEDALLDGAGVAQVGGEGAVPVVAAGGRGVDRVLQQREMGQPGRQLGGGAALLLQEVAAVLGEALPAVLHVALPQLDGALQQPARLLHVLRRHPGDVGPGYVHLQANILVNLVLCGWSHLLVALIRFWELGAGEGRGEAGLPRHGGLPHSLQLRLQPLDRELRHLVGRGALWYRRALLPRLPARSSHALLLLPLLSHLPAEPAPRCGETILGHLLTRPGWAGSRL